MDFPDVEGEAPPPGKDADDTRAKTIELDASAVHKYVAVLYTEPKRQHYWGRVIAISESSVTGDFLKQKHIGSNPEEWTWVGPKEKDQEVVDINFIVGGPVTPMVNKGTMSFPDKEVCMRALEAEAKEKTWKKTENTKKEEITSSYFFVY